MEPKQKPGEVGGEYIYLTCERTFEEQECVGQTIRVFLMMADSPVIDLGGRVCTPDLLEDTMWGLIPGDEGHGKGRKKGVSKGGRRERGRREGGKKEGTRRRRRMKGKTREEGGVVEGEGGDEDNFCSHYRT